MTAASRHRGRCIRARLGSLTLAAALLAAAEPSAAQRAVASGGYWRNGESAGHYRIETLDRGAGSEVRIEWVAAGEGGVVSSVTLTDLGDDGPWRVSNTELRVQDETTLLVLDASASDSDEHRAFVVELAAPGVAVLRSPR